MVTEYGALVETAILIGVFEDEDTVSQIRIKLDTALGVGVALGNPEPASGIPSHRNRLIYVRFTRKEIDGEAFW